MKRNLSTNRAIHLNPGKRPGLWTLDDSALKGRHRLYPALSGLGTFLDTRPKVLSRASSVFCPLGTEEKSRNAKRAVLEKQGNANMEGMGYGG